MNLGGRGDAGVNHNVYADALRWFRLEPGRLSGTGGRGETGALFCNGGEARRVGRALGHAHGAVVLAMATATGRKIRVGVRTKEGRRQQEAEEDDQRSCGNAAHGYRGSIGPTLRTKM
jgi:hypothetical protein